MMSALMHGGNCTQHGAHRRVLMQLAAVVFMADLGMQHDTYIPTTWVLPVVVHTACLVPTLANLVCSDPLRPDKALQTRAW